MFSFPLLSRASLIVSVRLFFLLYAAKVSVHNAEAEEDMLVDTLSSPSFLSRKKRDDCKNHLMRVCFSFLLAIKNGLFPKLSLSPSLLA